MSVRLPRQRSEIRRVAEPRARKASLRFAYGAVARPRRLAATATASDRHGCHWSWQGAIEFMHPEVEAAVDRVHDEPGADASFGP